MNKIQDLKHGVLFKFSIIDTELKVFTVNIEDVLSIRNEHSQKIDGLYVGQKIYLSEDITVYTIESISIENLSSSLKNFEYGLMETEILGKEKEYLFSIIILLRQLDQ